MPSQTQTVAGSNPQHESHAVDLTPYETRLGKDMRPELLFEPVALSELLDSLEIHE